MPCDDHSLIFLFFVVLVFLLVFVRYFLISQHNLKPGRFVGRGTRLPKGLQSPTDLMRFTDSLGRCKAMSFEKTQAIDSL